MSINHDEYLPLAFIQLYFDIPKGDLNEDVQKYINDKENYQKILDYLIEINLKNIVSDATPDTFNFVMPQFRFVCDRDYQLEIVKFDYGGVYLRKNTIVYATNLFVENPGDSMDFIIKTIPHVLNDSKFINNNKSEIGEKFYVWNGTDGIIFARPYVDWMGLKVCNGTPYTENDYFRMYILGDELCKEIIKLKIPKIPNSILKNYHKGTPLRRAFHENYVISNKKICTMNYDIVFDAFEEEFKINDTNTIHFVQRDYIFDAKLPFNLAAELQKNWISDTSIYKIVNRFVINKNPDLSRTVVIDRYSVNCYRKMLVVADKYNFPINNSSMVEYIFVPKEFLQIRHTLNAAFVPKLGIVILARDVFFGARQVLNFTPKTDLNVFVKSKITINEDTVLYHLGGSYFLEESYFFSNEASIYILVHIDEDLIVRHNLIRTSRKLTDLKYNWVYNTILSLFVRKY